MSDFTINIQPRPKYTINMATVGPQGPSGGGAGLEPIPSGTILGNPLGSPVIPQALTPSSARTVIDCPAIADSAQAVGMLQLDLWDATNDTWANVTANTLGNGIEYNGILVPHIDYLETIILDLIQASDLINRTSDPLVSGRIWHSSGTLRISLGPDPYSASLDFTLLANSGYIALIEDI